MHEHILVVLYRLDTHNDNQMFQHLYILHHSNMGSPYSHPMLNSMVYIQMVQFHFHYNVKGKYTKRNIEFEHKLLADGTCLDYHMDSDQIVAPLDSEEVRADQFVHNIFRHRYIRMDMDHILMNPTNIFIFGYFVKLANLLIR